MTRLQILTFLIVYGCLSSAAPAQADAVIDWNATAVQAITTAMPPHPGATGFLDMAMVQAAVYDAVESIDRRFQPYHVRIPGATGSPAAAVAKAAHDVLVNRFPGEAAFLDAVYHDYLFKNGLADNDAGVSVASRLLPPSLPSGPMMEVSQTHLRQTLQAAPIRGCGGLLCRVSRRCSHRGLPPSLPLP